MLSDGAERLRAGVDVIVGAVETHGRAETEALTRGYEIVPRREISYEGRVLHEMDLDAVLRRRRRLAAPTPPRSRRRRPTTAWSPGPTPS